MAAEHPIRRRKGPMASPESMTRLFRAAGNYQEACRSGDKERRKVTARELLKAARNWQESARANADALGIAQKGRPPFNDPPAQQGPENPPGGKKYERIVSFWASKYAWDIADGDKEAARESARQLLRTARIGRIDTQPSKVKNG